MAAGLGGPPRGRQSLPIGPPRRAGEREAFATGQSGAKPRLVDPILLRRRTGRTAALVIALGFGGTTLLLGVGGAVLSGSRGAVIPALLGYSLATLPLFALAAVIAVCRSELWLLPEERVLHLLTFRPWRLRPRVEEAKVSEYAGVRLDPAPEDEGGGFLVSLITAGGEAVPIRQFQDQSEAGSFAESVASSVGLWLRTVGQQSEPVGG